MNRKVIKLHQLLEGAENIKKASHESPEFKAWKTVVLHFLVNEFGEKSVPVESFKKLNFLNVGGLFQGVSLSEHQKIFQEDLKTAVLQLQNYLSDLEDEATTTQKRKGEKVFIGHGQSRLWRELKDFIQDRMHLQWDEFNRVPVAGIPNATRLLEMLDDAAIAFLLLTAEDEQSNGTFNPRLNVVHEAGLFQGRLGFKKAIVLLEEGCTEFSNITGLGQIRFPAGNISAVFEDIRQVLEREGLIHEV